MPEWNIDAPEVDASSPTGLAHGRRRLIVPEHNNESYQWIMETQQLLARGEWRIRHVDYDNAPFGRETHAPSPSRWWLALLAWFDHTVSGRPPGLAVEHAALFADPLLHVLLLATATAFVALYSDALSAALLSLGLVALFPFARSFLPGAPDHHGLAQICALWSVLPLLVVIRKSPGAAPPSGKVTLPAGIAAGNRRERIFYLLAGVAGGCGLWISAASQAPVLAGIVLGALMSAWLARNDTTERLAGESGAAPWHLWAFGGCAASLAAYMIEYFPGHMGLQLEVNHPLFSLAWLGAGVLLTRTVAWIQRGKFVRGFRDAITVAGSAILLVALPVAMALEHTSGFLAPDPLATRLTHAGPVTASNLFAWISRDGFSSAVWAALLPCLLAVPAVYLLARRATPAPLRRPVALAAGPVLIALVFACIWLRWWNMFDTMLLAMIVAASASMREPGTPRLGRWVLSGLVVTAMVPGIGLLLPPADAGEDIVLSQPEAIGLAERDLAHWLANRLGSADGVVLAAPDVTMAMSYYGGLRGLGTVSWENHEGVSASIRISSASSPQEALELAQHRGITHVIMPSWDPFLDMYARIGFRAAADSPVPPASFIAALHRWEQPAWLRPLPYQLPPIAGFEGQSALVFEAIDQQDPASAYSRLAEYFVEMGQMNLAISAREILKRFPSNVGALVAQAQIDAASGDTEAFGVVFDSLLARLSRGDDRALPWDRRVSLAIMLVTGKRPDLAREQLLRCLSGLDEARLRSLTTISLFRFQVLCKKFGLEISDQRLHGLASDLLHPGLRSRI
jgi:hypothetical protein